MSSVDKNETKLALGGGRLAAFGLIYIAGSFFTFTYLIMPHLMAVIWLPQGLLLYGLLAVPSASRWRWLIQFFFLCDLLVPYFFGYELGDRALYAVSNSVEGLCAASIYRLHFKRSIRIEGSRDVLALLFAANILPSLAIAGINTVGFEKLVNFPLALRLEVWLVFWTEDLFAGILLVSTLAVWLIPGQRKDSAVENTATRAGRLESLSVWIFTSIVLAIALSNRQWTQYFELFCLYLIVPAVIWAAVRTGFRGTTAILIYITATVFFCSKGGLGPFAGIASADLRSLLGLNSYLVVISITGLILSGLVADQEKITSEINSRLSNEQRLRSQEAQFRSLFEKIPDGVFIIDATPGSDGKILWINQAAAEMHGWTVEELVGRSISEINTAVDAARVAERLELIIAGNQIHFEVVHRRKNGGLFPVEVTASKIQYEGKNCVVGIDRDITVRRQAQEQLQQLREALEQRVIERTAELEAANRESRHFVIPLPTTCGHRCAALTGLARQLSTN